MMVQNMRFFWTTFVLSISGSIGSTLLTERFLSSRVALWGSFIGLQKSVNAGVAFGMELGRLEPLLIGFALCGVAGIAIQTARTLQSQIGFGLILGGGVANVFDRVQDGYVTDLFQIGSFPIFNVADSCVTVGVVLLLLEIIRERQTEN